MKLERALVGQTFGKKLLYHILMNAGERKWLSFGDFQLITIISDSSLYIFEEMLARDAILMKGLWHLVEQILGLDKWTPDFNQRRQTYYSIGLCRYQS